jgi:hypothetical protein
MIWSLRIGTWRLKVKRTRLFRPHIYVCAVVAFSCLLAFLVFSCVGVPGMWLKQNESVLR